MEANRQSRVFLWSALRCLSSVFERSIRELKGVKVIHEPHQVAYYYGPERKIVNNNLTASEIFPSATFQAADEVLLEPYAEYQAVFSKNHAYFIAENYKNYTVGGFSSWKHTFLIRNPYKSVPSLYKARHESGFTGFPETGYFKELYEMYETVRLVHPNPVVIDADDLLSDPRGIMQQYCCSTGLPFNDGMLTWTPGVVADWAKFWHYKVWHGAAMMSSGFMKPTVIQKQSDEAASLPREVQDAVEKALPFYEAMYAVRMKSIVPNEE